MPKNSEERRLLHQKGQQPTYGNGVPNNDEGIDGDLSYRKIANQHKQFLKQDGKWNEVGSSSSSSITSSDDFQKGFIQSELDFRDLLYKYRNTIMSWNYNWTINGQFNTNFVLDGTVVYLQFHGGTSISQGASAPGNLFVVPRSCYLENIRLLFTVPQNNQAYTVQWGFNLYVWETDLVNENNSLGTPNFMTLDYQSDAGTVGFGFPIQPEGVHAIVNVLVGANLNTDKGYVLGIEQIQGSAVIKGSSWSAYFKST
tara:strand:- start:731 stop:1498 length:768 start_codon:yes stop_codon:yes gene_type:complete